MRYRFEDPKGGSAKWRFLSQFAKFMIGWNLIMYVAYKSAEKKELKENPDFENYSWNHRILALMGIKKEDIITVKHGESLSEKLKEKKESEKEKNL